MIDFHAHLLPGIDDGSRTTKMTAAMLQESQRQGIEISVATPHFYFDKKTDKMLVKREKMYRKVENFFIKNGLRIPEVVLGFEVHLSEKIFNEPDLDKLLISGTNTMLVEMPRKKWDDDVFSRLDFLVEKGYDIVLAHPERYQNVADEADYERLFSYGLAGQVNAASLISPKTRDFAYKLISEGKIKVMGSDAHNMGIRANFVQIACQLIGRKLGEKYIEMMEENAEHFLNLR